MNAQIKKVSRLIISLLLCLTMITTLGSHAAQAKSKRGKFTITYKGKTITMMMSKTNKKNSPVIATSNVKAIQKAWKKPTKTKKGKGSTQYIYKKGKSTVSFYHTKGWGDPINGFEISIEDKNFKLCGIQVGMSRAKALKILKKNFDKSALEISEGGVQLWFSGYLPVGFGFKNNKVSGMSFWCS